MCLGAPAKEDRLKRKKSILKASLVLLALAAVGLMVPVSMYLNWSRSQSRIERLVTELQMGGQSGLVDEILKANPNICLNNPSDGWTLEVTLLMLAARHADPETCRFLIDSGVDPNARDANHKLAVHHAARFGRADNLVAMLGVTTLQAGDADDLLFSAAQSADADTAQTAIRVTREFQTDTSMHAQAAVESIRVGSSDILRDLLNSGVDPNARSLFFDRTLLSYACEFCREECIRLLLDAGADPMDLDGSGRAAAEYLDQNCTISDHLLMKLNRRSILQNTLTPASVPPPPSPASGSTAEDAPA